LALWLLLLLLRTSAAVMATYSQAFLSSTICALWLLLLLRSTPAAVMAAALHHL
jgi:hypothetical protein